MIPFIHLAPLLYIVIFLLFLSILLLYFFRWRIERFATKQIASQAECRNAFHPSKTAPSSAPKTALPSISLIVPTADQADHLKHCLPILLRQEYAGRFEVIVCDQKSSDATQECVASLQRQYENLRFIALPPTLRHITLRKAAITLGMKAARSEWAFIINPETLPKSQHWLSTFAGYLMSGSPLDIVSAYYNYYDEETLSCRRAMFERIRSFNLRSFTLGHGVVLGCDTSNVAVRKRFFLDEGGFSDNLNLPFGEEALFVYHHALPERTLLVFDEAMALEEQLPAKEIMWDKRIQRAEIARHMYPTSWMYTLREHLVSLVCWLLTVCIPLYVILRVGQDAANRTYNSLYFYVDLFFVAESILLFTGYSLFTKKNLKALHLPAHIVHVWFYDMAYPVHHFICQVKRFCRRRSFVRNFM